MKKFQAIIRFTMDEEFLTIIPPHRTYINYLINKGIIESYAVSMESMTVWITFQAASLADVELYLQQSPLYKYWNYHIEELYVYDSQQYRLPSVQLN